VCAAAAAAGPAELDAALPAAGARTQHAAPAGGRSPYLLVLYLCMHTAVPQNGSVNGSRAPMHALPAIDVLHIKCESSGQRTDNSAGQVAYCKPAATPQIMESFTALQRS